MYKIKDLINEEQIFDILEKTKNPTQSIIFDILDKGIKKKGLSLEEVGYLLNNDDQKLIEKMFQVSAKIKQEIYGERLVLFAPMYLSNYCINECKYCGFHKSNSEPRKKLSFREIQEQTKILINMGHKRLLVECGEHPSFNSIDYVVDAIKTIYKTKTNKGEIRRVNVNIAATSIENYKKLKSCGIGTYQLFQETYHKKTYENLHKGPKADYERQLFAHNYAIEAGIDDVGLGVLYGLYDYKFDTLSLISHSQYLEKKYGIGPHTISVPRLQPAPTVDIDSINNYKINEFQLLKIISIIRIAVPYTGMIISTREKPEIRAKAFEIGISQTSAASITTPGGYGKKLHSLKQFSLQDERKIDDVIKSILQQNLISSFCTACYRTKRTGKNIMKLLKSGQIHKLCRPNAILTFKEYLEDFASQEVKKLGTKVINNYLEEIVDERIKNETISRLKKIEHGKRDLYF